MKASTLFIRTAIIIAVLTTIPHAFAMYTPGHTMAQAKIETQITNEASLVGKWKTRYEEFDGEVVYEIRSTNSELEGFSIELIDDNGNSLADNTRVLYNITFENNTGTATYSFEYDGDTYQVKSQLVLKNADTLEISYSYWGYEGSETWKRIQ